MPKEWSVGDQHRRCFTGRLRGYLTTLRGCHARVAAAGQWTGSPKARSLALIQDYQRNVSAGRGLCPRAGVNCSERGARAVARYGAVVGWTLAGWAVLTCRSQGAESCGGCKGLGDC